MANWVVMPCQAGEVQRGRGVGRQDRRALGREAFQEAFRGDAADPSCRAEGRRADRAFQAFREVNPPRPFHH